MKKVLTVTLNPCIDKTIILDNFMPNKVNRIKEVRTDAGGKGINVSRALTGFFTANIAMGIIGGKTGAELKNLLLAEGVESDFLEVSGETRVNYKIFDSISGETTDINDRGIPMNEEIIDKFMKKYRHNLQYADFVVLSGSVPPFTDETVYKKLIEVASEFGVKAILDTNGKNLSEGIKAMPYAIKPNIHEFEELLGRKMKSQADILNGIKEINEQGVELAVVSMGDEGALFMKGNTAYRTYPLKLDVKSTVGCGDSVVAGIIYSLLNGFDLKKTAMIATACGSVSASKPGTVMCRKDEVMAVYNNIIADRIEFL